MPNFTLYAGRELPTRSYFGHGVTRVMCEMVGAVDARALGERAGHLSLDELRAVDDALLLVLDLR